MSYKFYNTLKLLFFCIADKVVVLTHKIILHIKHFINFTNFKNFNEHLKLVCTPTSSMSIYSLIDVLYEYIQQYIFPKHFEIQLSVGGILIAILTKISSTLANKI